MLRACACASMSVCACAYVRMWPNKLVYCNLKRDVSIPTSGGTDFTSASRFPVFISAFYFYFLFFIDILCACVCMDCGMLYHFKLTIYTNVDQQTVETKELKPTSEWPCDQLRNCLWLTFRSFFTVVLTVFLHINK